MSDDPYITPWTIIVDSREQAPYSFLNHKTDANKGKRPLVVRTVVRGLASGDYSIEGYEDAVAVERKSLQDAYSTFSQDRDRFERELDRLNKMEFAKVVVEEDWPRVLARTCPDCSGHGSTFEQDQAKFEVTIPRVAIGSWMQMRLCDVLRLAGPTGRWVGCQRCEGAGTLHPLDHSRFSPKSFFRSVLAWEQRYPRVHWAFCSTRAFAEVVTLRTLERFWLDEEEKKKGKGK